MIDQYFPKVTIAIPTYNRVEFLKNAILSCLNQTYPNIEILISNNASEDSTSEFLNSFKNQSNILIFNQKSNIGMRNNFNFCLNAASGDFFLLLSDDDLLESDAIQELIKGFNHNNISISYGKVKYLSLKNKFDHFSYNASEIENGKYVINSILNFKRVAYPSATLYRTNNIKSIDGFPEAGTACDFALFASIANKGDIYFVNKPVVNIKLHNNNLSFSIQALHSQIDLLNWFNNQKDFDTTIIENLNKYVKKNLFYTSLNQMVKCDEKDFRLIFNGNKIKTNSIFINLLYSKKIYNILFEIKKYKKLLKNVQPKIYTKFLSKITVFTISIFISLF